MYKLERRQDGGNWYEVMLSPFKTREDIVTYHAKYSKYYPNTKTSYRVTNLETGGMKVIR
jgi:lipocalin